MSTERRKADSGGDAGPSAAAGGTPCAQDSEVARLAALPIATISDAMDRLGLGSAVLDPAIRPMTGTRLAGRARTIDRAPMPPNATQAQAAPDLVWAPQHVVDDARPGVVVVMALRGDVGVAAMGDNMAARALVRGVAGVVVDGALRDVADVRSAGLPVYARTAVCRTAAGRMLTLGLDVPVICGGVWIRPGDIVIGDEDGVVVVPAARAAEVAARGEELAALEHSSKAFIESGRTLVEAIQTYKVR